MLVHLPVSDRDLHLRNDLLDPLGDDADAADPVEDDEHLSAALGLSQDSFTYELVVLFHHICLYRVALFRRLRDQAHVFYA